MPGPTVGVSIVTCNSERYIARCLDSVLNQRGVHVDMTVVDNASTDNTRKVLERYRSRLRLIFNVRNVGFAAAQNQGIGSLASPWILVLNPDVLLSPAFIQNLLAAADVDTGASTRIGTICGKLLSIGRGFEPLREARIDSAGIYFTPAMRHFDRGWGEPDDGRYAHREFVFGASAAAALYRRKMIEDVSIDSHFFDPDFFVYREDADVAWRAQLLGWRCLYTPSAIAHHVRTVTPASRRSVPAIFNMHSVKNRFLMRIKNLTPDIWRRYWAPMTLRDLLVLAGCLFLEQRSLEGLFGVVRCWRRAWRARRWIMSRRRISGRELAQWFQFQPVAMPLAASEPAEIGANLAS